MTEDLVEVIRLLSQITKLPTGCWQWQGWHEPKSGRPMADGRYVYRTLFTLLRGPLPPFPAGVLHHAVCGQAWCANPWHCEPMTQGEHMQRHGRGGDKEVGHAEKTHCPAGHPYDAQTTYIVRSKPGYLARQCRLCKAATMRALRARARDDLSDPVA